jgi:hypothetical protein
VINLINTKQKTNNKQIPNKKFHVTEDSMSIPQKGHKQIKHLNGADRFQRGEAPA